MYFLIILMSIANAQYFDKGINYFEEDESNPVVVKEVKNPTKEKPKKKFSWNDYLDPEKDEFFKEGNYTPPAPFVEVARNPSPENIKNYKKWLKGKSDIVNRINQKLMESSISASEKNKVLSKIDYNNSVKIDDIKNIRVIYYFSSTCPSCVKMNREINLLAASGVLVQAYQIDDGNRDSIALKIPFKKMSARDTAIAGVTGTPYLHIVNLKNNKNKNLLGFRTKSQILQEVTNWKM